MGGVINIGSNPGLYGASLGQYAPKPCYNFTAKATDSCVALKWSDPEDYTTTDGYLVEWASTRIVRKTGSYPVDENDGTVVVTSTTRNQYQSTAFTDSGLTNDTTYYYRAFPCSTDGIYNHEAVQVSAIPIPWKIMTVTLNLANSNPATCGSYADDATSMTSGKTVAAWQEFFGYRPCLFKNGKVVGYLNPDDYTKFVDGSTADITSGSAGDVMIEFPRRGVKISKSGKVVTVSMTNNPNNTDFNYYAHRRGSVDKDYFYLGAYIGYVTGSKLRSLSGKNPSANYTLAQYDTYGKALGTGYGCIGYYQYLYLQVMYTLQYKGSLNSQSVHGQGYSDSVIHASGGGNTKGLMYGATNTGSVLKIFGIEDLWGNAWQIINNFYVTSGFHIATTTDDTITDTSKYTDRGSFGGSATADGYITDVLGTSETGFIGSYGNYKGSGTTYFCDTCSVDAKCVLYVGGCNAGDGYGIYHLCAINWTRTGNTGERTGSRLGYL